METAIGEDELLVEIRVPRTRHLAEGFSPADATALAHEDTAPSSDMHASPEYRAHLARELTGHALESASALS